MGNHRSRRYVGADQRSRELERRVQPSALVPMEFLTVTFGVRYNGADLTPTATVIQLAAAQEGVVKKSKDELNLHGFDVYNTAINIEQENA